MKIKAITRNKDVISGNLDLETLYEFKNFPVFMGVTNSKSNTDKFFRMRWQISKGSGMLQLNPLLPLKILYPKSHNSGCTGSLWDKHHNAFANFIYQYTPKNVLEIGAAHGILFKKFKKLNSRINWTIIEPNPKIEKKLKVKIIKKFFNNKNKIPTNIDTFVHSHVLEHIYDLHEFMKDVEEKIRIGNRMIFSIPNLEIMLKRKYTNCINFEHTIFLTEPFIKFFLYKYGFKIIQKKYFKKDHSIFYSAKKIKKFKDSKIKNFYRKYKKMYLDYIFFHKVLIKKINNLVQTKKNPIFLFGAHVFSQYLINFGLKTKKIIFILDNDKQKQDKRLYGTNLKVKSPKILSKYKKPYVILRVGVYKDEIKEDILKNINPDTKFI